MDFVAGFPRNVDNCPGVAVMAHCDFQREQLMVADAGLEQAADHFVYRDGLRYAGTHLLLDLWDARHLDRADFIEQALRQAVREAGAELLHIHLHQFSEGGGISGVAVLAESHISVHTWPELGYAAFDIFMCGKTCPEKAATLLAQRFQPGRMLTHRHHRGLRGES